ncbi:Eukaryotic aspartyl protease family protein [Rhynchospora pubera]|uniref:Eukaryotic aspartyl protease family protein n=1 Tax=Rhynchospora pubera TaxID=906938 RepID=A0AAV8EWP9_9POAL|nr:Eukaryotic aspartyl protease family protein [Rhynchospora pubera]
MTQQPHPLSLTLKILFSICLTLFTSLPLTLGQQPKVDALVAPIKKDFSTSLYTIALNSTKQFLIDLAGSIVWSPCPPNYGLVQCTAPICNEALTFRYPDCLPIINGPKSSGFCRCISSTKSPVTEACFAGDETLIHIFVASTDGKNPTSLASADYVNICAPQSALAGLPPHTIGIAGFGRTTLVSLPARLAWDLSFYNQFALCLPSTRKAPGVAFFGAKPYRLLPPYLPDISNFLSYTTLLKSPNNSDAGYYLDVKDIAVNGMSVPLPTHELKFDSTARGGFKLSTIIPYTAMRSNIYEPFIEAYKVATKGIRRMPRVKPFELCFDTRALGSTRVGYSVPPIDIMLNDGKNWTIFGANSLKDVRTNTACLAFVNGGRKAIPAITLGGFQMEDSFLHFDVPNSTLGFIPTLRGLQTTCSNFNFTSGV